MMNFLKGRALYISGFANVALIFSLLFTASQWRGAENELLASEAALATERQLCNREKELSAAEAGRITSDLELQAERDRAKRLAEELKKTKDALEDSTAIAVAAQRRAARVQTLLEAQPNDPEDCGNSHIDADTWMQLRAIDSGNNVTGSGTD